MSLRALIPVAGAGTRLRPLTYAVPKSLLTVADKPIVGHILDGLQSAGIEEVVLIVGYKGDQLVEYVRNAYPTLKLHWVVQTEAQGLGHAIWCARDYLDGRPAVIVLGETLVELEWERFLGLPQNAVGVKQVEDPRRFGVITLQDGVVTGFVEKPENPPSDLALVGLYLILDTLRLREALEE
ncbi:MAG: nucleotidyltransferase family protein, partial [Bacteroidota bacterium]|nr:nucleotidyltransferase family protein [Bacteroidota bacterium]